MSEDSTIRYTPMSDGRVSTIELPNGYRQARGETRYETVVFDGKLAGQTERYTDYDEALRGHGRWVQRVLDAGPFTNADRIEKAAARLRLDADLDSIEWVTIKTIIRDLAANPDSTVQELANAVERPWEYAHLLVIDEDARAGRL